MRPDLTVAVMAYNEQASLASTVHELAEELRRCQVTWEILIIDDGSTDGTDAVAEQLVATLEGVRVIHHRPNRGLGGVYETGFAQARSEWLTFYPADGQIPASCLPAFLDQRVGHDLILGYIPQRPVGPVALFLSWIERQLYRALFGFFPRFQGILMVRCDVLRRFKFVSTGRGWGIVMEMVLRVCRGGHPYTSVPTTIRDRTAGESKVRNLKTMWANFKQLFWLRAHL